ncbi:4F2 cell-surface antigen heavy chain [Larimichthys crocea]|uniref:4F2 cell-surface antigen heavy chain n=1 Tax=Larimichthys crocea TaxID=215358 RepID=A0A0F8C4D6_LARCR|nr:4F2 cell-surface antigen heavy chain [Larimichthys crocea]KAE8289541.1 4F2 cell-surface antigen heavy chain [Larimichthys crocea]TMS00985.1 4F2 cell-surface antigen heavy chain [Larimichthys crocea]
MNTEETNVDLKDAETKDAQPKEAADPAQVSADADATEADVSEADLDQEEQEKQPMTGGKDQGGDAPSAGAEVAGAEKNGSVKLKIPEEAEEVKFTGLNKEELLRVAGTPGWVRTRWALLVVFWLGWLGMLVGAVLIILQAPRCRDLPATNWWNEGPLYQIGNIQAFTDTRNLKGVEQKVGSLSQLKVRGLVVGPIHVAPADEAMNLRFEEVSPEVGNLEQFKGLVQAAHKKGISVVLDLTPNYQGSSGPWFSNISVTNVAERLKSALVFWLNEGVDGVQLSGVERVASVVPSLWADIRVIVQNGTDDRPNKRVLIGVTEHSSAEDVSALLSFTGVDLLISRVLLPRNMDATDRAETVQLLYSSHNQTKLAWSLGGLGDGHLASLVGPALVKLHQLLLLTLPGTPVVNYGDEIGLIDKGTKFPKMLWESDEELNGTVQEERAERLSCRSFFRSLSELRGKERSLLFGDFLLLSNSSSSLVYLRVWDQSKRYLAAFNWAEDAAVLQLNNAALPLRAEVVFSTNSSALPADSSVDLANLQLGPGQATLLSFPYTG